MKRLEQTPSQPQKSTQETPLKTLVSYCVDSDTPKVKAFLRKNGIDVASKAEAKEELMYYIGKETKAKNGKNALQKLFDLHPDKDLILEFFGKKAPEKVTENYNSYELSGAETSKTPLLQSQTAKIAIVLAVVLALIIIIYQFD